MAMVCFPYLTGPVSMEDGTPVHVPDPQPGKYLKFKYSCDQINFNIMLNIIKYTSNTERGYKCTQFSLWPHGQPLCRIKTYLVAHVATSYPLQTN